MRALQIRASVLIAVVALLHETGNAHEVAMAR